MLIVFEVFRLIMEFRNTMAGVSSGLKSMGKGVLAGAATLVAAPISGIVSVVCDENARI